MYNFQQRNFQQRNSATAQQFLNSTRYYLMLMLLFFAFSLKAQFLPSSSVETIYPTIPFVPTVVNPATSGASVPGLYCNAHMSTYLGTPGDPVGVDAQIAEVAAWSEDNGVGWEDGTFTYGYTTSAGTYVPVGKETIPNAKHLSAAYMTDGINGYVVAAYVVKEPSYVWRVIGYDLFLMPIYGWDFTGEMYNFEYRIYDWPVPTSTVTLRKRDLISGGPGIPLIATPTPGIPLPHPLFVSGTGPLAPGFEPVYAQEGTLVMDVNQDATKVAFAFTSNGNWVQLNAGSLNPGGGQPFIDLGTERVIAEGSAKNPWDIAFRFDPGTGALPAEEYIHVLIDDGSNSFFVTQTGYTDVMFGTGSPVAEQVDDANIVIGLAYNGTTLGTGLFDHLKLDVPDISAARRWAYTWSDGNNIHVRHYFAPSSGSPAAAIGSSATDIVNNGSLSDVGLTSILDISSDGNTAPAIAYKENSSNIKLTWRTTATAKVPFSGVDNWVGVELAEDMIWSAPLKIASTLDYLDVQTNNTDYASKHVALSHHSFTTADLLYTTFGRLDAMGDDYLIHKNHYMPVSSTWRTTQPGVTLTGVAEEEWFSVLPNPFVEQISLRSNAKGFIKVSLADIMGRKICSLDADLGTLNELLKKQSTALSSGTYLLTVSSDKSPRQTFKLIKK